MLDVERVPVPAHPPQDLSILTLDQQRALRARFPVADLEECGWSHRFASHVLALAWAYRHRPESVR